MVAGTKPQQKASGKSDLEITSLVIWPFDIILPTWQLKQAVKIDMVNKVPDR